MKEPEPASTGTYAPAEFCEWGKEISWPGLEDICTRPATRNIVLHAPGGGEIVAMVRLCDEHVTIVAEQTDPHNPGERS